MTAGEHRLTRSASRKTAPFVIAVQSAVSTADYSPVRKGKPCFLPLLGAKAPDRFSADVINTRKICLARLAENEFALRAALSARSRRNVADIMLACSAHSRVPTLRASAYAQKKTYRMIGSIGILFNSSCV